MAKVTLPTGLTWYYIDPAMTPEQLGPLNAALAQSLQAGPERSALCRWIGTALIGNPRISKAAAAALLPLEPKDPNPFFDALDAMTQGQDPGNPYGVAINRGRVHSDPAWVRSDLFVWLDVGQRALIVFAGGDIEEEQLFLELASLDIPVPESFPERETNETFATWGIEGQNHIPIQKAGKYYRSTLYGAGGVALKASEWVPFLLGGGTILTGTEFNAIQ